MVIILLIANICLIIGLVMKCWEVIVLKAKLRRAQEIMDDHGIGRDKQTS